MGRNTQRDDVDSKNPVIQRTSFFKEENINEVTKIQIDGSKRQVCVCVCVCVCV